MQDNKIHLYSWNGTELKEDGTLDTPRGLAITLAASPDGKLLVSGDVSALHSKPSGIRWRRRTEHNSPNQATGKMVLFDLVEKKVSPPHLPL